MLKGFGKRLRQERKRLGMSVEDFAELSGIHANSLGNYERGERAVSAALMLAWHDVGVDVGFLLTGVRTIFTIGAEEQGFLDNFLRLDVEEREIVLALIARLVGDPITLGGVVYKSSSLHSRCTDYRAQPKEG